MTFEYASGENDLDETTEDNDDDLGYYSDGVKRTLTDEQIRIFRHSEIHALRREKELREEALAESLREEAMNRDEEAGIEMQEREVSAKNLEVAPEEEKRVDNGSGASGQVASRREFAKHTNLESGSLDYGEDGFGRKDASRASDPRIMGRRIISYED